MRLYAILSRAFPRSFTAKVFLIAFVGTHLPLIAFVGVTLAGAGVAGRLYVLGLLTLATLVGTGATLWALGAVLDPLYRTARHLAAWDAGGDLGRLPDGFADEVGQVMRHANLLMDGATRRLDHARIEAETDPLTGTLNRRGAERRAVGLGPAWVLMIDVDRFKAVNDRLGHEAGDGVLIDVASAVRQGLRHSDVLARFGGEEFLALLPGVDAPEASAIAERVRGAVASQVRAGHLPVTVSIGLAPHWGGDLAVAVGGADAALYRAKAEGRDRVCAAPDAAAAA